MKFKKILLVMVLLIVLLSLGSVAASDDVTNDNGAVEVDNLLSVQIDNATFEDTFLWSSVDDFDDLQDEIDDAYMKVVIFL